MESFIRLNNYSAVLFWTADYDYDSAEVIVSYIFNNKRIEILKKQIGSNNERLFKEDRLFAGEFEFEVILYKDGKAIDNSLTNIKIDFQKDLTDIREDLNDVLREIRSLDNTVDEIDDNVRSIASYYDEIRRRR